MFISQVFQSDVQKVNSQNYHLLLYIKERLKKLQIISNNNINKLGKTQFITYKQDAIKKLLNKIIIYARQSSKKSTIIKLFNKIYQIASSQNEYSQQIIVMILNYQAYYFTMIDLIKEAKQLLIEAHKSIKDNKYEAITLLNLYEVSQLLNQFGNSEIFIKEAVQSGQKLYKKNKNYFNSKVLCISLEKIGLKYKKEKKGSWKKYIERAIQILKDCNIQYGCVLKLQKVIQQQNVQKYNKFIFLYRKPGVSIKKFKALPQKYNQKNIRKAIRTASKSILKQKRLSYAYKKHHLDHLQQQQQQFQFKQTKNIIFIKQRICQLLFRNKIKKIYGLITVTYQETTLILQFQSKGYQMPYVHYIDVSNINQIANQYQHGHLSFYNKMFKVLDITLEIVPIRRIVLFQDNQKIIKVGKTNIKIIRRNKLQYSNAIKVNQNIYELIQKKYEVNR